MNYNDDFNIFNKRILIITGHYGSGKTNLAVNLAFYGAAKNRMRLVDLDIVNPYFRAADMTSELESAGVDVISPIYANTNLDIPALPPKVLASFSDKTRKVVLDVGGDDAGAAALGQFSKLILDENDFDHLYVINARRVLTQKPENAAEVLREVEAASHVPVTGIVNNTNLIGETDAGVIRESAVFASEVCRLTGLPLRFTCAREDIADKLGDMENILPVKIYVKTPWEKYRL